MNERGPESAADRRSYFEVWGSNVSVTSPSAYQTVGYFQDETQISDFEGGPLHARDAMLELPEDDGSNASMDAGWLLTCQGIDYRVKSIEATGDGIIMARLSTV